MSVFQSTDFHVINDISAYLQFGTLKQTYLRSDFEKERTIYGVDPPTVLSQFFKRGPDVSFILCFVIKILAIKCFNGLFNSDVTEINSFYQLIRFSMP